MEVIYIVDTFSRYQPNRNVVGIYTLNGHWYCIRQLAVPRDSEGNLVIDFPEKSWDYDIEFYPYKSKEAAEYFLRSLKGVI